ncbi:ATP synthase F1 subunit delta [Chloroflexota bacterium]
MARASARRYAEAVFQIALETGKLDAWLNDLETIKGFTTQAGYLSVIGDPRWSISAKLQYVDQSASRILDEAKNLLKLLVTKGHTRLAGEIFSEYRQLLNQHRGVANASIITAFPLDEQEEKQVMGFLSNLLNKIIILDEEVDPEIIGGIVARVEGKLLDGSTATKLNKLKNYLSATT